MTPFALLGAALALTSPAFHNGSAIPVRYTCDGANVSPPLRWTVPPRGTSSFALTMVDVTVGFLHWQALRIPASTRGLPANAKLAHESLNSFHQPGYGGPCPPAGPPHRYVFTLRALGKSGRVLAEARLVGRFGR
jgi:Raf kinase inhibitor-like YbhB/YbcL family protein